MSVAIKSGVEIRAHTTPDGGPCSSALVSRILAHHMALIPTLTLFEVEAKRSGASEQALQHLLDTVVQQVCADSLAGGQILFGTDVGYIDVFDTIEEYRQLGRALSWRQILDALTVTPARRFDFAARKGRVRAAMDADLVMLEADPAKEVTAFARVRTTLRRGRIFYRAAAD